MHASGRQGLAYPSQGVPGMFTQVCVTANGIFGMRVKRIVNQNNWLDNFKRKILKIRKKKHLINR